MPGAACIVLPSLTGFWDRAPLFSKTGWMEEYNMSNNTVGSSQPAGMPVQRMMTLTEAVQTCLKKYFCFKGRASRSEYWWWTLVYSLPQFLLGYCTFTAYSNPSSKILFIALIAVCVAGVIPALAVSVRRLHDTGCSGWWVLLFNVLIALGNTFGSVNQLPWFFLIVPCIVSYFYIRPSEKRPNKYGDVPCLESVQSRAVPVQKDNRLNYSYAASSQPAYVPGQRMISFTESVEACLKKYFCFTGRASRAEYWWWTLTYIITLLLLFFCIGSVYSEETAERLIVFSIIVFCAGIVPLMAVSVRRLHDTGLSGWWMPVFYMPVVFGCALKLLWLVLIALCIVTWFYSRPSENGPNKYGGIPCLESMKRMY